MKCDHLGSSYVLPLSHYPYRDISHLPIDHMPMKLRIIKTKAQKILLKKKKSQLLSFMYITPLEWKNIPQLHRESNARKSPVEVYQPRFLLHPLEHRLSAQQIKGLL